MELKDLWRWRAIEKPQKDKTRIPRTTGLFVIFIMIIIGIVAILVILLDDYSLSAWMVYSQVYWTSPPNVSRIWLILMSLVLVWIGHFALPVVYYTGPHAKAKFNIYIGWNMLDEDTMLIHLLNGYKIEVHKDRVRWYLLNMQIVGEYKYYIGENEKIIILEGSKYEVSAVNTLRKQLEMAERESSLWQYKYMQLLENLSPYVGKGGELNE